MVRDLVRLSAVCGMLGLLALIVGDSVMAVWIAAVGVLSLLASIVLDRE